MFLSEIFTDWSSENLEDDLKAPILTAKRPLKSLCFYQKVRNKWVEMKEAQKKNPLCVPFPWQNTVFCPVSNQAEQMSLNSSLRTPLTNYTNFKSNFLLTVTLLLWLKSTERCCARKSKRKICKPLKISNIRVVFIYIRPCLVRLPQWCHIVLESPLIKSQSNCETK